MQNLTQSFQRLSKYVREHAECDKNDEKINNDLRDFFVKFNDIQHNTNSTTIFLENKFSKEWENVLTSSFGLPVNTPTGKKWAFPFEEFKKITVTIWVIPRSYK